MIGALGFDSRRGLGIFLFATVSRTALGPTQHPIQRVPGVVSVGIKRPAREADHSPPSSAEVKNAWSYTSTPQYVFMTWYLVKNRDNFTFYIYLYHLGAIIPSLRYFKTCAQIVICWTCVLKTTLWRCMEWRKNPCILNPELRGVEWLVSRFASTPREDQTISWYQWLSGWMWRNPTPAPCSP
jgi:hypothetical protein